MRKFMSASEAAAVLGVSGAWARQLAASGRIKAVRTSAGWMLDADAVANAASLRAEPTSQGEPMAGKHTLGPGLGMTGGRAIRAAVDRGALSPERADYWAEQILSAASDDEARRIIAAIGALAGGDGQAPDADGEAQFSTEFAHLYPAQPGREADWDASYVAASAHRAEPMSDEEADSLFAPRSPEEADERQRIAASRRPRRDSEDEEGEELFAALFGDAVPGSGLDRPHAPHGRGRR